MGGLSKYGTSSLLLYRPTLRLLLEDIGSVTRDGLIDRKGTPGVGRVIRVMTLRPLSHHGHSKGLYRFPSRISVSLRHWNHLQRYFLQVRLSICVRRCPRPHLVIPTAFLIQAKRRKSKELQGLHLLHQWALLLYSCS